MKVGESYSRQTKQRRGKQRSPYDDKTTNEKIHNAISGRAGAFVVAFSSEDVPSLDS